MEIENVTITKTAIHRAKHAVYQLEYSINNGVLSWIRANLNELTMDDYGNLIYIGNIHYENNMVNCSLPSKSNISAHFEDFESIVAKIEVDVKHSNEIID